MDKIKNNSQIISTIKEVFDNEIEALKNIRENIDYEFEKAINCIKNCKGKVILSGVGKSGHIAKKISATLSSTGTKSVFIHPIEGMHGDLGIVDKDDCLLIISKSGKNNEIMAFIEFFINFNLPIISITANKNSELAKKSDIVLFMDIKEEACPINLAPTTSTTASLVIGDALAITLMKLNNFKKENFAIYHPAGQLGKRLLFKVSAVMKKNEDNPIVYLEDDIKKVIFVMTSKHLGATTVLNENGKFEGLITEYDLRIHINDKLFEKKAKDIMNNNPSYVSEDTMAIDCLILMENRNRPFSVLPVLNDKNEAVGMIHIHDLIKLGL